MINQLEENDLRQLLSKDTNIVQFTAGWCGHLCKQMSRKFEKMSDEFSTVNFITIDLGKFPEARNFAKIHSLPTYACFKGHVLESQIQTSKEDVLYNFVHQSI
ncbi:MAG: thioredoxin family protein [Bacteroidota bacterium]